MMMMTTTTMIIIIIIIIKTASSSTFTTGNKWNVQSTIQTFYLILEQFKPSFKV
jgi:hypothetical protein